MKLMIDTHYLLWMFMDTSKLSEKMKLALTSEENEVYYSQASLWEISIKYSLGKLTLASVDSQMDAYVGYGLKLL